MASSLISDELKDAILRMPQREKDRLLVRLLRKDLQLLNQLHFRLLEGEECLEDRKNDLLDGIRCRASTYPVNFYSAGYLMMELRDLSGRINEYRNITKDKIGEVELQLVMITSLINNNLDRLKRINYFDRYKLNDYIIKRAIKIINLLMKIHPDHLMDFNSDLNKLHFLITELGLENRSLKLNLDIDLLKNPEKLIVEK